MRTANVALGKVATLQAGFGFPLHFQGRNTGDYPFAKVGDISRAARAGEAILATADHFVAESDLPTLRAKAIPEGSILFAKIGEAIRHNHRVIAGRPMLIDNNAMAVVPGGQVVSQYLYHFLRTIDFYPLASATTVPSLRKSQLEEIALPLPSIVEQRRIAEVLDRAETLRAKRREALKQLEALTQAIFLDLFSAVGTENWPIVTIADVAASASGSIRTGPFGSQLLHDEFVDSGIAVLGIDNAVTNEFRWTESRFITEEKYRKLRRYTVQPGDVLITIMGTCGRCAIVPDDVPTAINTKHLCCITLDQEKCLPVFLHAYFLRHPVAHRYLKQTSKGAIMSGLNMGIIKAMPIPLPPISHQREFASRIDAVERLRAVQRASLVEMDALFASLQHRAFRGEL